MAYADFVRAQHQAILDQWLGAVNTAFIALPSEDWLTRLENPAMPGGGGHWLPLAGFSPKHARCWRGTDGQRQLWVMPEEKSKGSRLYAEAWAAFAALHGHSDVPSTIAGRAYAIDHLFPETAAARRGWVLVRAVPVDRRSNSLVGSTSEKVEARQGGRARPRTATSLTLAKVTCFQLSFARANDAHAVASALVSHILGCGLVVRPGAIESIAREIDLTAWRIASFRH